MSRRELERRPGFEQISPEVGELDLEAVERSAALDPDATLSLLAEMTAATDRALAQQALAIAQALFLDLARRVPTRRRGVGTLRSLPYQPDHGDLDLDASLDALATRRTGLDATALRVRGWVRPDTAWCLVVDRSGSMSGAPLATSALAAAAVALRAPHEYSVLAFAADVQVVKPHTAPVDAHDVVAQVLRLRGSGTTDVAAGLREAGVQLAASRAGRRITVLLSDCRANVPGDAAVAAGGLDELLIVAPVGDSDEAEVFAARVGARCVTIDGPTQIPQALADHI